MIEIIDAEKVVHEHGEIWACWLELLKVGETRWLPAAASGDLLKGELLAHFEMQEDNLWNIAEYKQYPADIYENIITKKVLRAFVSVVMDEINILRAQHALAARTKEQFVRAIKDKLKDAA